MPAHNQGKYYFIKTTGRTSAIAQCKKTRDKKKQQHRPVAESAADRGEYISLLTPCC